MASRLRQSRGRSGSRSPRPGGTRGWAAPAGAAEGRETGSELPAPYEATIDPWPGDDRGNWRKQRHTAVGACVRLRDELGHEGVPLHLAALRQVPSRGDGPRTTAGTPRASLR